MSILPFAVGLLTASYIQNKNFRASVDNGLKNLINTGINTLNNIGSVENVPTQPVEQEPEE
jgi:hypothetical protein